MFLESNFAHFFLQSYPGLLTTEHIDDAARIPDDHQIAIKVPLAGIFRINQWLVTLPEINLKTSIIYNPKIGYKIVSIHSIYIYICSPPPRSTFCILLSAQSSTRKLFAQFKEKQKKQKNKKQQKNKKNKTLRELWGNSGWDISLRVLFFCFFCFLFVCSVYDCFGHILDKNTFHYRPLVFTISLRKRLFPKYFRQFILNFFLWRPGFSTGSSLLSLKTGLFQREVASREESSIWTNRLCVKQDFVKRKKGIIWTELVRWGLSLKKKCYLEREWIIRKNVFFKNNKFWVVLQWTDYLEKFSWYI